MSAAAARRGARVRLSNARSSAHPAPLKLRIQATLDFRVNSAPSQLQRSASACQGQRSREMAWRVQWRVGSACLLRIEESARARTETTKPAAKRKLLLQLLLPLMRLTLHVESFCGAIAAALLLQLRKQQLALRHRGTAALLLRSWLLARTDWWLVCTGAVYGCEFDADQCFSSLGTPCGRDSTVVRTLASRAHAGKTERARSARKR